MVAFFNYDINLLKAPVLSQMFVSVVGLYFSQCMAYIVLVGLTLSWSCDMSDTDVLLDQMSKIDCMPSTYLTWTSVKVL